MKTFTELVAELKIVKRGPPKKHMTATQKMQRKKLAVKKQSIQRNPQGIAKQKIVGGKKVQRSSDEIKRATMRSKTTVTKVKTQGGLKPRRN